MTVRYIGGIPIMSFGIKKLTSVSITNSILIIRNASELSECLLFYSVSIIAVKENIQDTI